MNIICDKPLYFDELKAIYGESKPKIQIITHDDMDGYASAAVLFLMIIIVLLTIITLIKFLVVINLLILSLLLIILLVMKDL